MNEALEGFLLGFPPGFLTTYLFVSVPFGFFLSLFGVNAGAFLLVGALAVGVLFGLVGAVLALLFASLPRYGGFLLSAGMLAAGLLLFQPEIDALGFLGLMLAALVKPPVVDNE